MAWLNLFLLTITCALIIVTKGESDCSPLDDKYFDLLTNKCKYCRKCPKGTGRRFDEARNSKIPINNTECLPCIGCDIGTFYDRNDVMSECRNCTHNKCGVLNRHVDKNCTATGDFECGHCLPGFDDGYKNTRLACRGPPIKLQTPITPTTTRQLPHSTEERTHGTIQLMLPLIFGALVLILAIVVALAYCLGCRKHICRNASKIVEQDLCVSGQSNSTIVTIDSEESALLNDHDVSVDKTEIERSTENHEEDRLVEKPLIHAQAHHIAAFQQKPRNCSLKQAAVTMFSLKNDDLVTPSLDGPIKQCETDILVDKKEVVGLPKKQTIYEPAKKGENGVMDRHVKDGSVEGQEMDGLVERDVDVRAEMQSGFSVPPSTYGGRPVEFHTYETCDSDTSTCKIILYQDFEKCSCHQSQCGKHCKGDQLDALTIGRDSPLLHDVASSMCHDPTTLFRRLNVPDAEVYGLDDDRQRRPDKISQREFIQSVLKRWTELMTIEANVGKLRHALCYGGFHRINEAVVSKYRP